MSAVKASGTQYYMTLTPHEFMLVTKGLIGALEEEPVERAISGSGRGETELVDEEKDARSLAFRLLEQRKKTLKSLVRNAEQAEEEAWHCVKVELA